MEAKKTKQNKQKLDLEKAKKSFFLSSFAEFYRV